MLNALKSKFAAGLVGVGMSLAAALVAPNVGATNILVFGQLGTGNPVTATAGASSTTIFGTDVAIIITGIEGGAPVFAFLDFTMTSTDQAICQLNPLCGATSDILQHYSGTFSINSLASNLGTDYLSGSFIDSLLGHGGGIVLTATTPPTGNVLFTVGPGSTITTLGDERALSLSFSNVLPPANGAALCGNALTPTVCSFTSSISGNMSAGIPRQVPEPGTVALLGLALAGLGFSRRKQK